MSNLLASINTSNMLIIRLAGALLLSTWCGPAQAHSVVTLPPARNLVNASIEDGLTLAGACEDFVCGWYTQNAVVSSGANCDKGLRTLYTDASARGCGGPDDWVCSGRKNPWCNPGTAPVKSPCGLKGGGVQLPGSGGAANNVDMLSLPPATRAVWESGSTAHVAWAITVNHGGGYSWRLCPSTQEPTEKCFQDHVLKFIGATGLLYANDTDARVPISSLRAFNDTWTVNPIPMVIGSSPVFPPPADGAVGKGPFSFSIVDDIEVPASLSEGSYVLSFRWDAEATSQVWSACSDVYVRRSTQTSCEGASSLLPSHECTAWMFFYDATSGPQWKACSGFRLDPCKCRYGGFNGVWCTEGKGIDGTPVQHLHELYLQDNNLRGTIPSMLGSFETLRALDLDRNQLSGSIPTHLGMLSSLNALFLDYNHLSGTIPSELTLLSKIEEMQLDNNMLQGAVPPFNFSSMYLCLMYGNDFTNVTDDAKLKCGAGQSVPNDEERQEPQSSRIKERRSKQLL